MSSNYVEQKRHPQDDQDDRARHFDRHPPSQRDDRFPSDSQRGDEAGELRMLQQQLSKLLEDQTKHQRPQSPRPKRELSTQQERFLELTREREQLLAQLEESSALQQAARLPGRSGPPETSNPLLRTSAGQTRPGLRSFTDRDEHEDDPWSATGPRPNPVTPNQQSSQRASFPKRDTNSVYWDRSHADAVPKHANDSWDPPSANVSSITREPRQPDPQLDSQSLQHNFSHHKTQFGQDPHLDPVAGDFLPDSANSPHLAHVDPNFRQTEPRRPDSQIDLLDSRDLDTRQHDTRQPHTPQQNPPQLDSHQHDSRQPDSSRRSIEVPVNQPGVYRSETVRFSEFIKDNELLKGIYNIGFTFPSEIQFRSIPLMLDR